MVKRLLFFLLLSNLISAQNYIEADIEQLFNSKKYSAAQALCQDMIFRGKQNDMLEYYNAKCSKELFLSDATSLYHYFLEKYPYSAYSDKVYEDLGLIYFNEENYAEALLYLRRISDLENRNDIVFKIGYICFRLDSLNESVYYFSKLLNKQSKYTAPSQYYYAYIAYKKGLYNTSLLNFELLLDDKQFKEIVPYYIAHIYSYEKKYRKLIEFMEPRINNVISSRYTEISRLLADAYYKERNYLMAIKYYKNYLENSQATPLARYFLGYSYYKVNDYKNAITQLEKTHHFSDSLIQYSAYYLAASYLETGHKSYALQAFKKAANFDYNFKIKEDAYFNYAKLAYELDLPFENTFQLMQIYCEKFDQSPNKKEIEDLMLQTLKGTNKYIEAYNSLKDTYLLSEDQQYSMQQLSYFLGVQSYNSFDYIKAVSYFKKSLEYPLDNKFTYLSNFWLADSYYKLKNYTLSVDLYKKLNSINHQNLLYYNGLKEYNLAYCYFDSKQYDNAVKHFRIYEKFIADSIYLHDTYLRIGDCFFMNAEYSLASNYYNKAINYGIFDIDYALYQSSLCAGLMQDNISKIKYLKEIQNSYQKSVYYDNAIYNLADYYKNQGEYKVSLEYYNDLLLISQDFSILAQARLSRGMIYFNQDKIADAISEFLFVVNNYQNTNSFRQAIEGLQLAYISIGDLDQYFNILESIEGVSLSETAQDSLVYNAAFIKFSEGNYELANNAFSKYRERFKQGVFLSDAIYYNAVSSLNIGDTISAVELYLRNIKIGSLEHKEESVIFLARYYYGKQDFAFSNEYYEMLNNIASTNSFKREAIIRLMYGYKESNSNLSYNYAKEVVLLDKIDNWLLSNAYLIIARKEFNEGNYSKARKTYQRVQSLSNYNEAAEAVYFLIYFNYLDDNLDLAEQMIFNFSDEYNNDYFLAKAYLLLSDIYVIRNNNFQAKATLESIIDNHEGKELVNIARKKLEDIIERELLEKKNTSYNLHVDVLEDDVDYDIEIFQDSSYLQNMKGILIDSISNINIDSLNNIKQNEDNN